jgi:SAM-dependent methyltransferase
MSANASSSGTAGTRVAERCVWCGAPFEGDAPRLHGRVLCRACGAATTDPWPTDAELDEAYTRYRPRSGRFSGPGDAIFRRTRGALARRLDRIAPAGPVLDVGAGDGALIDSLRALGRQTTGLERNPERADLEAHEITDVGGEWAAVVFWHTLEHLREPGAALRRAAELLLPGGVLVLALPNGDSLQARVFGDRWLALDLPRHLVHVPARTLLATLRAHGLRVERVSHWRGGQVVFGWLHGLVGLLPGRPDLYDAIRRPPARMSGLGGAARVGTLAAAVLLLPLALAGTAAELLARRGGSVYVEARRA